MVDEVTTDAGQAIFADAPFWRTVREHVVPLLRTYPSVRVWVAGCGGGEAAFATAIVLQEHGLAGRAYVYATDRSGEAIEHASAARLPTETVTAAEDVYQTGGGRGRLVDHFRVDNGAATLAPELIERMMFAVHDPASDASFNEFHLVLIHDGGTLEPPAQARGIALARESLCRLGILGLGERDQLPVEERPYFEAFVAPRLHRRRR